MGNYLLKVFDVSHVIWSKARYGFIIIKAVYD